MPYKRCARRTSTSYINNSVPASYDNNSCVMCVGVCSLLVVTGNAHVWTDKLASVSPDRARALLG